MPNIERDITRRLVLQAGLAGVLSVACGTNTTKSGDAPQVVVPEQNSPLVIGETKKPTSSEISAKDVKFVYPEEITTDEWNKVIEGSNIPLPFGSSGMPANVESLTRRIKAGETYKEWAGREIEDKMIGFQVQAGAEIVAICDGSMVLLPDGNDPHSKTTTRILFRPIGAKLGYLYLVGGKNHDWVTQMSRSSNEYTRVKAGQPILTINTPARVQPENYADIISNIPSIYNFILSQITLPDPATSRTSVFREDKGIVTSSQLSIESLKKNEQGLFVGLYSTSGK